MTEAGAEGGGSTYSRASDRAPEAAGDRRERLDADALCAVSSGIILELVYERQYTTRCAAVIEGAQLHPAQVYESHVEDASRALFSGRTKVMSNCIHDIGQFTVAGNADLPFFFSSTLLLQKYASIVHRSKTTWTGLIEWRNDTN